MTDQRSRGRAAPSPSTPRPQAPARHRWWRRWWRRRPLHRVQLLTHRWPALVLGLFLVVETTSGAVLLYDSELFRAANGSLYHHTASADPITPSRAIDVVAHEHPTFGASWVARDGGVYVVGEASYHNQYFVDPGTGHINGQGSLQHGFLGLLANLHDCGLGCAGYPGFSSWAATPIWDDGPTFMSGITRGGFAVGVTGVLLLVLVLTSLRIWWPGWRRLRRRTVVRTGRGRFARDFDLHNVVGALALPFLLMWAITGAAFEFPVVEKAWLSITGGEQPGAAQEFTLTPHPAAKGTPPIGDAAAVAAARREVPGRVTFVGRPTSATTAYEIDIRSSYAAYAHRAIYSGDAYVLVDPHDASHVKVLSAGNERAANRFYDKFLEPTHFGWNVDGWWRILWCALGLAPLVLMITGVSTWLYRRGVRRRRRRAGRASLDDAVLDPDADDVPTADR